MKLFEIKTTITNQSMGAYERSLFKKKIKELGRGSSGTVFAHPTLPNIAVKVFVMEDYDYRDYIKWSQRHQNNPYVPKFYGDVKYFELSNDTKRDDQSDRDFDNGLADYGIVFMERLQKMSAPQWQAFWRKNLTKEDARYHSEGAHFEDKATRGMIEDIIRAKIDPKLVELCQFIKKFDLDIRRPNLMMRGSQVVFVDPITQIQDPFE